ncbi:MAG: bifunctional enoyl-CoA hydratase/phosphate acetyltransferase [Betaproteobacteria bacterium]|jgi:phosphotransacetylase/acyl dehydratase|nr:bifunctional enoyl-CoA hydratase/phosphate acetyltransferase [Betaproteobacteria bacterium]
MRDVTNRTFSEIRIGTTESAKHTMTMNEIEGLALVAGEVDPFHVEGRTDAAGPTAPGAAAIALVSNLLLRRMPGPGTTIAETELHYAGTIAVGDELSSTVTAKKKRAKDHRITFACRCVNQRGEVLVEGLAHVVAPTSRVTYSNVATPSLILRRNDGFAALIRRCQGLPPVRCAVVHPCDRDSLFGALEAARRGLIVPVLVGPEAKIRALAKAEKADLSGIEIVATEHSHAAAEMAVEMARLGQVEALMKGSLHTDELMAAIVPSTTGLRTARRISHVFVMDVPTYPRLLFVTDAAVNIFPTLDDKVDIVQNAIDLARTLGIEKPKVAVLSALEMVTSKIESTLHAAALCKMADRGQITGGEIDGPLAFDNAISVHAAKAKKIASSVAGRADILLVPDLEAGNMMAKQLQYLAGADAAGIVLGTRVPVVLTSRADTVRTRLASTAVMVLVAHAKRAPGIR